MDARFDLVLFSISLDRTFDTVLLLNVIMICNTLVILALLYISRTLTHPLMLQRRQQQNLLETVNQSMGRHSACGEGCTISAHRIRQCMEELNKRARDLLEKRELGGEELEHLLTLYVFIIDCIDAGLSDGYQA